MRSPLDALSDVFDFLRVPRRCTTQGQSNGVTFRSDHDSWSSLCEDWYRVGQDLRRATDAVVANAEKR